MALMSADSLSLFSKCSYYLSTDLSRTVSMRAGELGSFTREAPLFRCASSISFSRATLSSILCILISAIRLSFRFFNNYSLTLLLGDGGLTSISACVSFQLFMSPCVTFNGI